MPDAAHRFVIEIDGLIYRHQLSDELAVYLRVQVAREAAIDRGLDWSALVNHIQGVRTWRGHSNHTSLPTQPGKGQFFKVWSLKRAKEVR
jgi:hypothetical protein